jgi:hypothetical protein
MPELERITLSNKPGFITVEGHALSLCNSMLIIGTLFDIGQTDEIGPVTTAGKGGGLMGAIPQFEIASASQCFNLRGQVLSQATPKSQAVPDATLELFANHAEAI